LNASQKYYYCDQVKEDEMGGASSTRGKMRNTYMLVVKPELKRPLGRPRRRWEDNMGIGS